MTSPTHPTERGESLAERLRAVAKVQDDVDVVNGRAAACLAAASRLEELVRERDRLREALRDLHILSGHLVDAVNRYSEMRPDDTPSEELWTEVEAHFYPLASAVAARASLTDTEPTQ